MWQKKIIIIGQLSNVHQTDRHIQIGTREPYQYPVIYTFVLHSAAAAAALNMISIP